MVRSLFASMAISGAVLASTASAEEQFIALTPTYLPNFFGLVVGSTPDYIGSDDNELGAAPVGRYTFGTYRYVSLQVNYATINLVEDRNWRAGPAGMWRFARDDVDDKVVDELPDIDGSLDLGGFVEYENVGDDPRNRWALRAGFLHGVTGDNDGYTLSASARRWFPVGKFAALSVFAGTTYGSSDYMDTYFSIDSRGAAASGLDAFRAKSGVRDVRAGAIFLQALSREWQVGAGFLYSRLLNDASDSPIVSDRGDRDQFVFGVGITRAF